MAIGLMRLTWSSTSNDVSAVVGAIIMVFIFCSDFVGIAVSVFMTCLSLLSVYIASTDDTPRYTIILLCGRWNTKILLLLPYCQKLLSRKYGILYIAQHLCHILRRNRAVYTQFEQAPVLTSHCCRCMTGCWIRFHNTMAMGRHQRRTIPVPVDTGTPHY